MKKKKQNKAQVFSAVFAAINISLLLLSSGYALYIRHSLRQAFEEMGVELSVLSLAFLSIHWVIWILVTLIITVLLALKERISKKRITLSMNGIFFVMLIAYWLLFTAAMLTPVMIMTEKLNNG